jgi:hypothetical protein
MIADRLQTATATVKDKDKKVVTTSNPYQVIAPSTV